MKKTDPANWRNVVPTEMTPEQKVRFLQSEIAEMKETASRNRARFQQVEADLKAQLAWWQEVATQAQMFLTSITNTAALSGRGWIQIKAQLDAARPKQVEE